MSEAEEGWSDDDGDDRGHGGGGAGRGRGGFQRGRGRGGRAPVRARIVTGAAGAAINRGDTPWIGPLNPIPPVKTNYPRASQPVLLRKQNIGHADGSNYAQEVASMQSSASFAPSASYVGARNFSGNGNSKLAEHTVWIPIPRWCLNNNPETLVDLRATTEAEILMAHAITFLLKSVSTIGISTTKEHNKRSVSLSPGMFVASDGTVQPRSQAFVHSVFAPDVDHPDGWSELLGQLPSDPAPGEPTKQAETPNVFVLNELNHPSRAVGYLVQVIYHDPTLHPNVQFAYTILNNRMLKMVDERAMAEEKMGSLMFRTNRAFTSPLSAPVGAPAPTPAKDSTPAAAAPAPKPDTDDILSGDEAEEVDEDEELNSEEEAREAEKMRATVEKRSAAKIADPANTDEGRRLAEKLNAIVLGASDAKAPAIVGDAVVKEDAVMEDSDSSDGGSYDPSKPDEASDGAISKSPRPKDEGSSSSRRSTSSRKEKGSDDKGADEVSMEEAEEEPKDGMTLDDMLANTVKENGGKDIDSEEERELAEEKEGGKKSDEPKRKSKRAAAQKKSPASDPNQVDEAERAIREKAASINAHQQQRFREVNHGANPFAIEAHLDVEECKEQQDKELSAIKDLGPAYRAHEAARLRLALQHREQLPCLFERSILDLRLFSTSVIDPILRAACSPLSMRHRDGMYDSPSNLNVEPYKYWMLSPDTPLHYSKFCSFEVARQVLLRSFPERIGTLCHAASPQFDYFSYAGTPDDPFFRTPCPWLTTSYRPEDLNPEVLAAYKIPGARSACDAILDQIHADAAHDNAIRSKANRRLGELYEHPRAPSMNQRTEAPPASAAKEPGVDELLEGVPHAGSSTQLLIHLNKFAKERRLVAAREKSAVESDKGSKDDFKVPEPRKVARGAVQYDNDYKHMTEKLDRESRADMRSFAADAGVSAVSKERARFGTHSVLHGARTSGGASSGLGDSGKRSSASAPSGLASKDMKRIRQQSESDQMAWLAQALRAATDEIDRQLIQGAITRIREEPEERRSAVLAELSHPGDKSPYSGVAECCRRVLSRAAGTSINSEYSGASSGGSISGGVSRHGETSIPVHHSNEGAAELLASHSDSLNRTEAQLSEYKINGPIDKLKETRTKKYEELVAASLKLPFRSNIKAMRDWLNKQCPDWITDANLALPSVNTLAEDCGITVDDCRVLMAMTYEREERLRHEWLADTLVVFRGESSQEVCAVMSATNDDLSDALRSMLVWLNSRPDQRIMVRPVLTFDPTLTPLATAFTQDLLDTAECKAMNEAFGPRMMRCLWVERLTMLRTIEGRLPDIFMLHGPPGCGKSLLFTLIGDATPPNTMIVNHWSSKLALMTADAKGITNTCTIHHEAPSVWAEGSRADPHHREQANMLKSMTTEQSVVYKRNTEDPKTGKRRLEKVHLVYHHNLLMGTNTLSGDAAMRDRMRAETATAAVSMVRGTANRAAAISNQSGDADKQRAAKTWRDDRWDEVAVIALVESMIAGIALPDVDTKVFEAVRQSGEAVISSWVGKLTDSNRPYIRGDNEARQLTLQRTYHVYFRSEASPFLTLTTEVDPKTGEQIPHLSMDKPKEFIARDLPTLIPTSLFATYGEAIPAYFSLLHTELFSFDEWRILNVLAAMLGFTDDYMAVSYHRFGVKLPDVLGKANQRRPPGSPPITSRRDTCSYLRDYYDNFESRVRQLAVTNQQSRTRNNTTPRPRFISTNQFRRLVPGASDCTQAQVPAKSDDSNAPIDPELNATMIFEYFPSADELITSIVSNCQGIITGIDREVVTSLLGKLRDRPAIRAPIHKSMLSSVMTASNLGFEGTTIVTGSAPNAHTETIAPLTKHSGNQLDLQWRPIPVLKIGQDSFTKRYYVGISTYALMLKWPELIYMALTAHEGPHTREARCVLPIGYTDAPLLMHIWTTRPNPFGNSNTQIAAQYQSVTSASSLRIRTPTVLPGDHRSREKNRTIVEEGRMINNQLYDMSCYHDAEKDAGKSGVINPMSTMDIERASFVKFLKGIHYVPPDGDVDQPPSQVQDVLTRYAYIAPQLLNCPGNVERYIQKLRRTCPELKKKSKESDKPGDEDSDDLGLSNYPEDFVDDTIAQNDLAFARQKYDEDPDAVIEGNTWRKYLAFLFPEQPQNDLDEKRVQATKTLLNEVYRAEEQRRIAASKGAEELPPHHPCHPEVMIAYQSWLRAYNRSEESFSVKKRCEVLAANNLTVIAKKAFEEGEYDTLTDYLVATAPGVTLTQKLHNGVRVPVATVPKPGHSATAPTAEDDSSTTGNGAEQGADTGGESEGWRKLQQVADQLASRKLGEMSARAIVESSGRSSRAKEITKARKKQKAARGKGSIDTLRGGEEADAENPSRRRGAKQRKEQDDYL